MKKKVGEAMTYKAYRLIIDGLVAEGKTTGENQSDDMLHYTKMNVQRMKRIDKTIVLLPETLEVLGTLKNNYTWMVLTEGWCGDAAQLVPVLNAMAGASDKIELRLLLRDEHLDLMDQYLTDGGRSIPKLIALRGPELDEVGTWGPRPAEVQELVNAHKAQAHPEPYMEFVKQLQLWYTKNKTKDVQNEIVACIREWEQL